VRGAQPHFTLYPVHSMIQSRLFDYDPLTGITRIWHWDTDTETATIETKQPVDDVFDHNKHLYNQNKRQTPYGDMERMATIPMALYYDLARKGILYDQKALKRWLNDRDNLVFRTRPGVV